jgi:hypothetical protein
VLIGVAAANYYAHGGGTVFTTRDLDLFLPLEAGNLLDCWRACDQLGLDLWSGEEPLDSPHDTRLAELVVARRSTTRATDDRGLQLDLTLTMAGFDFESVWKERRTFVVDDVQVPVARLLHIVESKHAAGREKDRLFLATHRDALQDLLRREDHER